MKVCIFDIKRFAIHDGPGIRTTVFLKGCPLDCHWCHNPEGITSGIEKFTEKVTLDGVSFEKEVEVGRWIELDELMDELEKDRVFMEESSGGISFSGGEPLYQHEALFRLLEMARERGLHSTVDTSGHASREKIKQLARLADLILFDLKCMDEDKHHRFTGQSNRLILDNLEEVVLGPAEVIVRIPLIPGFNDSGEDITSMVEYLKGLGVVESLDLLPYHAYGTHKYKRFKREDRQQGFKPLPENQVERIRDIFNKAGFRVRIGG
jgi:pyruvate formate lyase activating enzyme